MAQREFSFDRTDGGVDVAGNHVRRVGFQKDPKGSRPGRHLSDDVGRVRVGRVCDNTCK